MTYNYSQIVSDIDTRISKSGAKYYSQFYVGITNDIHRRLFTEHKVDEKNGWWIWYKASSKQIAQDVEEHYLYKGMQGDTGGGTDNSVYVYCYYITNNTEE